MKFTKQQISLAVVVLLSATTTTVSADAFDGPYVGAGLAVNKMSAKLSSSYTESTGYFENDQSSFGGDKFDVAANLAVGYGLNLGQFNLAFELSFQNSYGESKPYTYSEPGFSESISMELTKGVAVSVMPGFRVGKDTLLYGRLGYVRAKGKVNYSDSTGFSESGSAKLRGMLYGIGMKHAFTPNLSALLEYQAVNFKSKEIFNETGSCGAGCSYSDTTSVKPSSNGVLLGMQYSF